MSKIITGVHFLANLQSCDDKVPGLVNQNWCKEKISLLIKKCRLKEAGSYYHTFGTHQGISGIVALHESHLSLHTWPELRYVTLDVFVCNYRNDNSEKARYLVYALIKLFRPEKVKLKKLTR